MKKIGITGGIGSGKTAVTDYLEELGYTVLDADLMSRALTAPGGKGIPYIRKNFGDQFITAEGGMNRSKMRDLVFRDKSKLQLLEKGTTRILVESLASEAEKLEREGCEVLFFAVPLLMEMGKLSWYDSIWLVTASEETRIKRVISRDGVDRGDVLRIIKRQMPEDEKKKLASEVITNDGDLMELRDKINELLKKYDLIGYHEDPDVISKKNSNL